MFREYCKVLKNEKVAPGHYVIAFASGRIGKNARPGQFVQILCSETEDPLLPRPFSFLTADKNRFTFLYHVVGRGTEILSQKKRGESLWVLGPLGNGFDMSLRGEAEAISLGANQGDRHVRLRRTRDDILLVGGGVGIPPLYHLAETMMKRQRRLSSSNVLIEDHPDDSPAYRQAGALRGNDVHVFLGARDKALLLCEKEFKKLDVTMHIATDNGSRGHRGFITELLGRHLAGGTGATIYTCGPTAMMKAVSVLAQKYEVPCEVSVEVPMACGFGACLGCAVRVRDRFAIACTEGPVFEGKDILWD